MRASRFARRVSVVALWLAVSSNAARGNLLQNPGFETDGAWSLWSYAHRETWAAKTDAYGLGFYGWGTGGGGYQDVAARGVSNYTFSAWGFKEPAFLSSFQLEMKLEFLSAQYATLGVTNQFIAGTDSTWVNFSIRGVSPVGTEIVRVVLAYTGMYGESGGFKWDDCSLTSSAFAPTIAYVAPGGAHSPPFSTWATAATNIQAAIDAVNFGGLVLVSNGVYDSGGRVIAFGMTNRIAVTNAVTVQSVNGPTNTFIVGAAPSHPSGADAVRCVSLGAGSRLSGFTVTNGHTIQPFIYDEIQMQYGPRGGGVWCDSGAVVSNCVITGCRAMDSGGGAYYGTYLNCRIEGNLALDEGGGAAFATLRDCEVLGNTAGYYQHGGGTYGSTNYDCVIAGNVAHMGGGVCMGVSERCLIVSNAAPYEGGGAQVGTLRNCILAYNTAHHGGGAASATLENCTVVGNHATNSGGGTRLGTMRNTIVYFNTAGVSGNNWTGGVFGFSCTTPEPSGDHNTTADPLFADRAAGNFRLASGSPCLDAGTNLSWITTDFGHGVRPQDGNGDGAAAWDIGAYEAPAGGRENLLRNPGFETGYGAAVDSWIQWGDAVIEPWASRNDGGTNGLAFYCWTAGGGVYQDVEVAGHSNYLFTIYGFRDNEVSILYYIQARLEFLDANGATIDFVQNVVRGTNEWQQISIGAPSPAGCARVRCVLSFSGSAGPGGGFKWDDAVLSSTPAEWTPTTRYCSQSGAMVYPYTNWAMASRSIAAAVRAAGTGDTILVDTDWFNIGGEIVVDKPVHIRGIGDPSESVVSGDNLCRVFHVTDPGAVIEGLTITRGRPVMTASDNRGGGVYMPNGGTLLNCRVVGNTVTGQVAEFGYGYARGGGIYCEGPGLIEGCYVASNLCTGGESIGGGIYVSGMVRVAGCTVVTNHARGGTQFIYYGRGGIGGGIYATGGAEIESCTISHNLVTASSSMYAGLAWGGGAYLSDATIRGSRVSDNTARSMESASRGYATAAGAGIASIWRSRIENCVVWSNRAAGHYAYGGGICAYHTSTVVNCSIAGNSISLLTTDYESGGGLFATYGCEVLNTTLYDNYGPTEARRNWNATADVSFRHTCTTPRPDGTGNITNAPAFANTYPGDLRLTSASPCIDAGTGADGAAPSDDFDGMPRPLDGNNDGVAAWDIGAHEFLHALADSDGDGLRDTNELAQGFCPAAFDMDEDGMGDGAELRAGTDPLDGESFFDVLPMSVTNWNGAGIVVRWSSAAGRQYMVARATDLTNGFSAIREHIVATPPVNAWTDTTATAEGPYFYRVKVE